MTEAIAQFERELFQEHIEEASFLYEQRCALMFRASITWTELAGFESRRQAHLDALESGGDQALRLALRQALASGEEGDVFVVVSLCCRLNAWAPFAEWAAQVSDDVRGQRAIADALVAAAPSDWAEPLRQISEDMPALKIPVIAFHGGRGLKDASDWLVRQQAEPDAALALCQCYARLGAGQARDWLLELLARQGDEEVLLWGALALAVVDERRALAYLRTREHEPWTWLPLALVGGEEEATRLHAQVGAMELVPVEGLLALGLHGYTHLVEFLLSCLNKDALALHAAEALNIMLGAELYEERFEAEELDPDELNEEELALWRNGQRPPEPSGQPAGSWSLALSRDPETWRAWWSRRAQQFPRGRYRHGESHGAVGLLDGIRSISTANHLRQWNALELAIRHGVPWQLDLYASVTAQRRQIQAMEKLVLPAKA